MKFTSLKLAGFGGALALMTMGAARAEIITIAPDGTVQRSENTASVQQQSQQNREQESSQREYATPEVIAGMPSVSGSNNSGTRSMRRDNRNDHRRDNRHRRNWRHDRDNRNDRNRHRLHGHGDDITIIGDNTDVYIVGRPGYGYGYPSYGGYPVYGYPYGYDYPYGYGYYGGTYSNGTTVTYGDAYGNYYSNGPTGMQPAWPNMGPAPGMANPFGTRIPQMQPRLPRSIYNQGHRR